MEVKGKTSLKNKFICIGFYLLIPIFTVMFGVSASAANGGSAGTIITPGDVAASSCLEGLKKYPNGSHWDHCGAGFGLYSVDSSSSWPKKTITSTQANKCKSVGADQIYVLALHYVKMNGAGNGPIFTGQFGLGRAVRQLLSVNEGGSGIIPYVAGHGALAFSEVLADHKAATKYAQDHPELNFKDFLSTPWRDVTWFCWNPAWENTTSSFDSWSFVDEVSTGDIGPDSKVTKEITTTETEVTVNFKHQFSYNKPTAPEDSVFGPAATNWQVDVTEDGQRISGYSRQAFTLINSGPNRNSVWDDMLYLGETTYTVQIPEGTSSKTVCSKISYSPKTIIWDEDPAKQYKMNHNESNGSEDSEACIIIKRDPKQIQTGDYTSTTTVKIPAQGDDIRRDHQLTSEEDGTDNNIVISTDQADVNVEFWHEVIWHGSICPPAQMDRGHDTCDAHASTPFTVTSETGGQTQSGTHSGATSEEGRESMTVHLEKGETKKVCRRITYTKKTIPFESYPKKHGTGLSAYTHTHYKIVNPSGTGYSEACATITRPADPYTPSTPDPYRVNGPSIGGNTSTPMFAGETSDLSWEASTVTYDVRRLMEWQAISYQVPVTTVHNNDLSKGNIGNQNRHTLSQTPCDWYKSKTNWRGCVPSDSSPSGDDEQIGSNGKHKYTWSDGRFTNKTADISGNQALFKEPFKVGPFGETIVVPNLVGDKHCNSFGFKMQYYYAYIKEGEVTWYKDTDNPAYWTVYDAACRAIAKKPSVAVWNGGLTTGAGNVITSLASRYQDTSLNTLANAGNNPRLSFGSWTEYLATINGKVDNFSSGAVLAAGSGTSDLLANSPLTIANSSERVGYSGISRNTILYNRLHDYLFNKVGDEDKYGTTTSSAIGLGRNQKDTRIVVVNGKLTIDENIELSDTSHSHIYTLPQVVIFAKDGIDIASNVTRIDAWLVTEGAINTCAGNNKGTLVDGRTESRVTEYGNYNDDFACYDDLTINGPVFANNVILNRTYGADGFSNNDWDHADSGDTRAATAEVFNLSADTYLWAYAQSGRYGSSYSEAYSRELPPRY